MSQPYTRSQLSEKLRQLRKKYRTMAGRLARGQSSSRLSQHDRDLLHLSTRLWDPVHASTSPFSAPDVASAGSSGNKRRRPIPSAPALKASASSSPQLAATEILLIYRINQPHVVESNALPEGTDAAISHEEESKEDPILPPAGSSAEMKVGPKNPAVNWILDVLDDALKEVRSVIAVQGAISSDDSLKKGVENKDLLKRWQEQRLAELDLIAQRWS
ncbi:hypothetical protein HPP92_012852 [Vanilla planifolia]|uniref:Glabrous enhancer-binding protein-like DBD domain-containing protein n=1 Tax=Vanilla planifolia TaxID=51239 RepID=A0A835UY84_VANPL|nr:hypothetical protein HPP92_012852 [Vanilla planifolia]